MSSPTGQRWATRSVIHQPQIVARSNVGCNELGLLGTSSIAFSRLRSVLET